MDDHRKVVEAALFLSPRPLGLNELAKIAGVNSLGFVKTIVEGLEKEYEKRGIEIVKTPSGWQMQAKQEFLPKVSHLTPYSDLSNGCKRTLALVAYKEPLKQSEVIRIQGNKAYSYIKSLVRMGLIKTEKSGRTKLLKLTQEFERYFGEERKNIREVIERGLSGKQEHETGNKKGGARKSKKMERNKKPKTSKAWARKELSVDSGSVSASEGELRF